MIAVRMEASSAAAVIVGAGGSSRMGGLDKVFAPLCGRPIFTYALALFDRAGQIERTVLVVAPERLVEARHIAAGLGLRKPLTCVGGGARRRDSVLAGLRELGELGDCEWVVVHDAARPLVTEALVDAGLRAARRTGAAVPGLPIVDTVKAVNEQGLVAGTPDRAVLRAIQTPQVFRRELLLRAHAATDDDATDDAALVERLGAQVTVFPGDPRNLKITAPHDLAVAVALLGEGPG